MQSISRRFWRISLFLFALLFHALFIDQGIGLNLFLVEFILLVGYFWFKGPLSLQKKGLVLACYLLSIYGLFWVHSYYSILLHFLFVFLLIGSNSAKSNNILEYAIHAFLRLIPFSDSEDSNTVKNRTVFDWIRLLFFPFIVILLFFVLYANAIPNFLRFFNKAWSWLPNLSMQSFVLLLIGFLTAWYTWKRFVPRNEDLNFVTELQKRYRNPQLKHLSPGLRNEYLQWLMTLACLIGFGSIALAFDIRYIWLESDFGSYDEAQWALRKGTGMLIIAILASLFFSLYVFRGNLYFYKPNGYLKKLTVAWLVLNGLLSVSLLVRTVFYIQEFNLAYKRIGVLLFIVCALFAIASIIYRLFNEKNMNFLLRINLNMIAIVLAMSACVNWDKIIVNYNLSHTEAYIDYDFLFTRDLDIVMTANFTDQILASPILGEKNFYYLKQKYGSMNYEDMIQLRIEDWKEEQDKRDWTSWNPQVSRVNKVLRRTK